MEVKFVVHNATAARKIIASLGARKIFSGKHKDRYYYQGKKCFKINHSKNGVEYILIQKFPTRKYFRMTTVKRIPKNTKTSKLVVKDVVIYHRGGLKFYLQKFEGKNYLSIQGKSFRELKFIAKKFGAENRNYVTNTFDRLYSESS